MHKVFVLVTAAIAFFATTPAYAGDVEVSVFADGYYMRDWNMPDAGNSGDVAHRAYAFQDGFALSWAGTDLVYDAETVGATLSLRYGPSTPRFLIGNPPAGESELDNVTQAFATWKPSSALTLDFGQFGTIYGAEVGESWQNINYTRGALYYLMQPFYHTGLRANYAFDDSSSITALVVNGINDTQMFNDAPDIGLQISTSSGPLSLNAGWLLSWTENDEWAQNFFDVVANLNLDAVSVVFNWDFAFVSPEASGLDDNSVGFFSTYYGLSLAARVPLCAVTAVGLRGEYLSDPDGVLYGFEADRLVTGTLTLEYAPTENLTIRLDNRYENADNAIFATNDAPSEHWFSTVLGVVAHN